MDIFDYNLERYKYLLDMLDQHQIPESYPEEITSNFSVASFQLRERIIPKQGFALLTMKWLRELAVWIGDRTCVELMAGCGSLSYGLQQLGVNIHATDNFTWGTDGMVTCSWNIERNYWTSIENIDCVDAVEKYSSVDLYIMSWAYMDDTAYRTLLKMREVNPNAMMVFIGEDYGGCTADDNFFETLIDVEDETFAIVKCKFVSFPTVHDYPRLIK